MVANFIRLELGLLLQGILNHHLSKYIHTFAEFFDPIDAQCIYGLPQTIFSIKITKYELTV